MGRGRWRVPYPNQVGDLTLFRLLTAAVLVPVLLPASTASAPTYGTQTATKPPGCTSSYSRADFHRSARRSVRRAPLTSHEKRTIRRVVRCQRSARSRRVVRFHWQRYRRAYHRRQAVLAVTPYPGPNGTRWSIPWRVVACESGGRWGAYNPSGAAGPYQIMAMHGRPFPVRTSADRLRHHQIAANLWRGGAGASHWVCK